MRYMNEQKSPQCEPMSISAKNLQNTLFVGDEDQSKDYPEENLNLFKVLEDGDQQ